MAISLTHAMVLAAGKGTRMRHISETTPKPLVEVDGVALLSRVLDHVSAAGISTAVVNVHYLADQIEEHLTARTGGPDVIISDEREMLLETGGGVLSALEALGDDPFAVINSDALWLDAGAGVLGQMAAAFDPDKMDILMALVPRDDALGFDGAGDFFKASDGALTWRGEAETAPWVFSGIQILSPAIFEGEELGCWSLKRVYDQAASEGRLYGITLDGHWMHVGTPEGLEAAETRVADLQDTL